MYFHGHFVDDIQSGQLIGLRSFVAGVSVSTKDKYKGQESTQLSETREP